MSENMGAKGAADVPQGFTVEMWQNLPEETRAAIRASNKAAADAAAAAAKDVKGAASPEGESLSLLCADIHRVATPRLRDGAKGAATQACHGILLARLLEGLGSATFDKTHHDACQAIVEKDDKEKGRLARLSPVYDRLVDAIMGALKAPEKA